MSAIYDENKDEDGFLYMTYTEDGENHHVDFFIKLINRLKQSLTTNLQFRVGRSLCWFRCGIVMFRCIKFEENSRSAKAKISFKLEHSLEWRQTEASHIRETCPDRIPVIVEKAKRSNLPDIDEKRYLVPADLTVAQFVNVVRSILKLDLKKAIFVVVNNTVPSTATTMSAIYVENKDEDGFLYMTYTEYGENHHVGCNIFQRLGKKKILI